MYIFFKSKVQRFRGLFFFFFASRLWWTVSINRSFAGQKVTDEQENIVAIKVDDDRVLNCCAQLKHQNKNVILLTNDKNLINKVGSYDIVALTAEDYAKEWYKMWRELLFNSKCGNLGDGEHYELHCKNRECLSKICCK